MNWAGRLNVAESWSGSCPDAQITQLNEKLSHLSSHCLFVICFRNVVFVNPDRSQWAVAVALSTPVYLSLEKIPSVYLEGMSYRHLG